MKKILVLSVMFSLMLAASCGGGGTTATTTSTGTKVVTEAATKTTMEAAGNAIINALQPAGGASIVLSKASTQYPVNYTGNCQTAGGAVSGTFTVTGTSTASCSESGATITCSNINAPVTVVFTNCAKAVTLSGTTYNEVLNGTATTTATGTLSGTASNLASLDLGGAMSGTVTLTGDAAGTADLSGVTYSATGDPADPTIECSGTTTVTITGQAAQICTVAADCKGCQA